MNVALAHTLAPGSAPVGEMAPMHANGGAAQLDPFSGLGVPYKPRRKFCHGKNMKCTARKALGTDYCVGHLRSLGLFEEAQAKNASAKEQRESR